MSCTLPTPEDAEEGYGVVFIAGHCALVEVWDRTSDGSYRVLFDDDSVIVVEKNGKKWQTTL